MLPCITVARPCDSSLLTLGLWLMTNYMLVTVPQAGREVSSRRESQQDWFVEHLSAMSQLSFIRQSSYSLSATG